MSKKKKEENISNCMGYTKRHLKSSRKMQQSIFLIYFFGLTHLATCIFYNEPELGVGIDPGMALTPLPSSIGLDGDRTHDLPIVKCSTARPQLLPRCNKVSCVKQTFIGIEIL